LRGILPKIAPFKLTDKYLTDYYLTISVPYQYILIPLQGASLNNKAIGVYIIVLILVGLFVWLVLLNGSKGQAAAPNTTQHTNTTKKVPTNITTNKTANVTSNTTTIVYAGCISSNINSTIYNGNFSSGTYSGWISTAYGNASAPGFGAAPNNITYDNSHGAFYASQWNNYNGTYFASTFDTGTSIKPGNLTSMPFKVDEPYLNFKIIAPQNQLIYFELLNSTNATLEKIYFDTYNATDNPTPTSTFQNASVDLVPFICKTIRIRVVAGVVGSRINRDQFVAVGDFYLTKLPVSTKGIVLNESVS
jgi:hypothetical protein